MEVWCRGRLLKGGGGGGGGGGAVFRGGGGGGGGEVALFLFDFFKVYHFYILKLPFAKLCYAFEHLKKKNFSAIIIL